MVRCELDIVWSSVERLVSWAVRARCNVSGLMTEITPNAEIFNVLLGKGGLTIGACIAVWVLWRALSEMHKTFYVALNRTMAEAQIQSETLEEIRVIKEQLKDVQRRLPERD